MRYVKIFLLCIFAVQALVILGCSATQPVRVTEEGTTHVTASLGGPLIPYRGSTIVVPYLTGGIAKGVASDASITGAIHLTTMLFGNVGFDAGYVKRLVREEGWIPEVTAKGQFYFLSDLTYLANVRFFPVLSINGSYVIGSTLVYGGTDHLLQLHRPAYFFSPFMGSQWVFGERWNLQTEIKWMAANVNTAHGIFEGHGSLHGYGNVGIFLGLMYRW
jgi:hypothetical protein